ncbi:chlorophyll synthesis pathway protein BchC [Glacieibacterium sp.]|uniref:chlorophyll synthesis pathway protein BchC n=1 Tax=Glacieibacterium sp. TaxID=2860237 RepID=UPI003B00928C
MDTSAVVMEAPGKLGLRTLALTAMATDAVTVEIDFSGISTGTERLLYTGRMPSFPGMGYPLVPGYESVGRVVDAAPAYTARIGQTVFIPGANCFEGARGLFGGAARRLVVPAARAHAIAPGLHEQSVLLALAATAHHALVAGRTPELIVGHGVLGRLLARITVALGHAAPTVWESNPARAGGATGYAVTTAEDDDRRDYACICDMSGAADLLDTLVMRLAKGGEIVLGGFYEGDLRFAFAPAFMREASLRIAAEWAPADLVAVNALVADGRLSLDGLITHRSAAADCADAYPTAFGDAACLKMILDWRAHA